MKRVILFTVVPVFVLVGALAMTEALQTGPPEEPAQSRPLKVFSVDKDDYITVMSVERSEQEWRELLTEQQFYILRDKGTEPRRTGIYDKYYVEGGVYRCAGCGQDLFHSEDKYDSKSGWPSYHSAVAPENVIEELDRTQRIEVLCSRCGGHLGHVFRDGPPPTGLRYCINSAAISFAVINKQPGRTPD